MVAVCARKDGGPLYVAVGTETVATCIGRRGSFIRFAHLHVVLIANRRIWAKSTKCNVDCIRTGKDLNNVSDLARR